MEKVNSEEVNKVNFGNAIHEIKEGLNHLEEALQSFYYAEEEVGKYAELFDDFSECVYYYHDKIEKLEKLIK